MPAAAPRSKRARPAALEGRVWTLALPSLGKIRGIAVATDGTIFVATNSALFSISKGRLAHIAGSRRETGYKDGQGDKARFDWPTGLAVMADGSLLVADCCNNRLRQVSLDGTVTTVAGSGQSGHSDGTGTAARFSYPFGVVVDRHGTIFVSDQLNYCIRKVTPGSWAVSTLCGSKERQTGREQLVDRFTSRLMIPIADVHGRVIGFGARLIAAMVVSNS